MNLYKIMFAHHAQRGSQEGIAEYLFANTDEDVYEWLKSDGSIIDVPYKDREEDGELLDGVPFKESIIESRGCMFNDSMEVSDLYYGATEVGWKLVKEGVSEEQIQVVEDTGIFIARANK